MVSDESLFTEDPFNWAQSYVLALDWNCICCTGIILSKEYVLGSNRNRKSSDDSTIRFHNIDGKNDSDYPVQRGSSVERLSLDRTCFLVQLWPVCRGSRLSPDFRQWANLVSSKYAFTNDLLWSWECMWSEKPCGYFCHGLNLSRHSLRCLHRSRYEWMNEWIDEWIEWIIQWINSFIHSLMDW